MLYCVFRITNTFFWHSNNLIARNHSVPSQDYTANDSSNRCFECLKMQLFESMCARARIVVVKSDPSSAIVLRCSSGTIAACPIFPKKQAIICLAVLRVGATFVGFASF